MMCVAYSKSITTRTHEHETKPKRISRLGVNCVDYFTSISDIRISSACFASPTNILKIQVMVTLGESSHVYILAFFPASNIWD